jgi:hypothetical protein
MLHELEQIRGELLRQRIRTGRRSGNAVEAWQRLGRPVTDTWDGVSAMDEIAAQREKG